MNNIRLYSLLTFAGAAPFIACALLPFFGIDALEPLGRLDVVASSYGLAIISFLAGAHWATHLYQLHQMPLNLFVTSNVIFLAAWIAFIIAPIDWQLLVQVLALVSLLFIDVRLRKESLITAHYIRMRATATALACGSLLIIALTP